MQKKHRNDLEIIWTYPFGNPLRGKEGAKVRFKQFLRVLNSKNYKVILLLSHSPKIQNNNNNLLELHSFNIDIFSKSLEDVGKLLLSLNPTYMFKLLNFSKRLERKIIINTFPLGSVPLFFLKKMFGNRLVLIYDSHNVEKDRYAQKAISEKETSVYWWLKFQMGLEESILVKIADHIIVINKEDKKRFAKLYNVQLDKIIVIPPSTSSKTLVKNKRKEKEGEKCVILVFHGSYHYLPNKEAVQLLREEILPTLSKKYRIKCYIGGTRVPKFKEEYVEFIGFVEELYTFLASCDIAVVPLKRGAGTKLKILDYMAVGLPIVTTKKGAEGLDLVNGKHAMIVNDVNEEFIKAIEYLIENPKMRRKLGHNAKKLLEKKYSEEKIEKKISEVLKNLTSKMI